MIFIKQTVDYLKRNFFYLVVFALVPSVFYAVNNSSVNIYNFFKSLWSGNNKLDFLYVYKSFSMINYNKIHMTLLTFASTIIFVSLILSFIEKHMRIGKKSFSGLIYKLNDNIIPVFMVMFLLIAIYELWAVILSAVIIFENIILGGEAIIIMFIMLTAFMFYLLLFILLSIFAVWLPCILITGFNYSEAFVYSVGLMSENKSKISFSLILPYLICSIIAVIANFLLGNIAAFIVLTIAFLLYFIYYSSLIYIIYFYLTKEKREDLPKKYF